MIVRQMSMCFLVFLLSCLVDSSQAHAQRRGIPLPASTVIPDGRVEVEMLRYRRLPMVEAMINGEGPFRLIVDTGASGLVLNTSLVEELDLPSPPGMPAGQMIRVRAPGSNGVDATLHYADDFKVGGASFKGVWTIGMQLPFGEGMDGVVGMDVFNGCLLTYDYPGSRMIFEEGELPDVNHRDILEIFNPMMPNSHPHVELNIDGVASDFLIDTGLRGWFAAGIKQMDALDIIHGPVSGEKGMSAAGPIDSQVVRVSNTISAGDVEVKNPIVRLMGDVIAKRIVGTFFLENFKLTFDAKNHRVRLDRDNDLTLVPPALRSVGFGLKQVNDEMVVWYVNPKSDASKKGVAVDDVVLEINGQPAHKCFGNAKWDDLLNTDENVTVKFQSGKGGKKTIDIQVLEILPAMDED